MSIHVRILQYKQTVAKMEVIICATYEETFQYGFVIIHMINKQHHCKKV